MLSLEIARGGGHERTALAAEQTTVERIVFDDLSTPRKILRHRVLHQLLPTRRDAIPIERGPDGPAHGGSIVIVEHAARAGAAAGAAPPGRTFPALPKPSEPGSSTQAPAEQTAISRANRSNRFITPPVRWRSTSV